MPPLYTKIYKKNLDFLPEFDTPEAVLANYFSGAFKHMQQAVAYHDENEIEQRLKSSEKAMFVLSSILGILEDAPEEERAPTIPLIDFLLAANHLITRFNISGKREYGRIVRDNLQKAAESWQERSLNCTAAKEENFSAAAGQNIPATTELFREA